MLPYFGGVSMVWITALLFFQACLLAGYSYAHVLVRFFDVKKQIGVHLALMALCALSLPLVITNGASPESYSNHPVMSQITLMAVSIGPPFFMLASCTLLLQSWFTHSDHPSAGSPYFLYAASNAGSLFALLSYPVLAEPLMSLSAQKTAWGGGYYGLIALVLAVAVVTFGHIRKGKEEKGREGPPVTADKRAVPGWLFLSFVPCSLMMGLTTHVTTDIASVPLLWVVPLALYLLTFIIAFARGDKPLVEWLYALQIVLLAVVLFTFIKDNAAHSLWQLSFHMALFFVSALICHSALVHSRPHVKDLTTFYMVIALGGVLGGVFNVLIAPVIFPIPLEYPLLIGLACFARYWERPGRKTVNAFAAGVTIAFLAYPGYAWKELGDLAYLSRNYFGVIRVYDEPGSHELVHGTTYHGMQATVEGVQDVPLAYYHPTTPAGDIFKTLDDRKGPQKIAGIGLGVGSIACYDREGRSFDFYEINPEIIRVAQDTSLFTFLSGCGSPYRVIEGDGRLQIEKAGEESYDMIFLDAFNSDNIPVHLLTEEAFALYFSKLKPDGLLVVHLTNRHLSLQKIVAAAGRARDVPALFKETPARVVPAKEGRDIPVYIYNTEYAVMSRDENALRMLMRYYRWHGYEGDKDFRPWTDDYSNILGVLKTEVK